MIRFLQDTFLDIDLVLLTENWGVNIDPGPVWGTSGELDNSLGKEFCLEVDFNPGDIFLDGFNEEPEVALGNIPWDTLVLDCSPIQDFDISNFDEDRKETGVFFGDAIGIASGVIFGDIESALVKNSIDNVGDSGEDATDKFEADSEGIP